MRAKYTSTGHIDTIEIPAEGAIYKAFAVLQENVGAWVIKAFGKEYLVDKEERAARFLEEAIETCQAAGLSYKKAIKLVDQVYDKPVGEIKQEIGGAMHTLLALSESYGVNAGKEILVTIEDVWEPSRMARIVGNHKNKVRSRQFGG